MSGPVLEAQLRIGVDMSEAEHWQLPFGEVAWFTARRPGRDGPNEDSLAVLPISEDSVVLVVADGAGGLRGGADASALAVRALDRAIAEGQGEGWMLRTAILNGIERANQAVVELGVGAATTLAAVEVADGQARPYHVGDSPILCFGGRGKLKLETVSHSPVGFAIEAGLLAESDAMHHEDRHLVSNLLGESDMRIEVGSSRALAARDTLVVASDGLSDNLLVHEIAKVARGSDLREACDELASIARRRMYNPEADEPSKPDDLTVVMFRRGR